MKRASAGTLLLCVQQPMFTSFGPTVSYRDYRCQTVDFSATLTADRLQRLICGTL